MSNTEAARWIVIALALGLFLGACVGWQEAVWYYAERLEEVEEIEPERVDDE